MFGFFFRKTIPRNLERPPWSWRTRMNPYSVIGADRADEDDLASARFAHARRGRLRAGQIA